MLKRPCQAEVESALARKGTVAYSVRGRRARQLRGLLPEGATSAPTKPVDDAYFDSLRRKAKSAKPSTRR